MIRAFLRRLLLRGPLLAWWIRRRGRQQDRAYCDQVMLAAAAPPKASSSAPSVSPTGALRTILFIADCMWEQNDLVPELRKIAPVSMLNLRPFLAKRRDSDLVSRIVAQAVENFGREQPNLEPDVILFYARPSLLSEEVFHHLRARWRCPLFGMSLDDKFQFFPYGIFSDREDNYAFWAKRFDLNLTNSLAAIDWYRQRDLPCLYLPQGVHHPAGLAAPGNSSFKYEFTFLGSRKPERETLINHLLSSGAKIRLFGSGWPESEWVEEPNAVFRSTQLNLGIGFATPSLAITMLKGRDFECPGAGACYLTTYNWELPLHWELGKEILCYRSVEELLEMYAYFRKRPEQCLQIAQAAWRRAVNEHTWEKRFQKIFKETGFRA